MSRAIEIIDPEGERRYRIRRRIVVLAVLASLSFIEYPEARDYYTKLTALRAGREFVQYLSRLRTQAILNKKPMEARFLLPDKIEVFETTSCGPFAEKNRVTTLTLGDFAAGIQFAPEQWVRDVAGSHDAFLRRYCYDPLFGSSIFADGLVHGTVFLAHHADLSAKRADHLVAIIAEGAGGDLSLE